MTPFRSTATKMSPGPTEPPAPPERAFDVEDIRKDFPALHQDVNGHPLVYLDNAATTQKPQYVLDALDYYYRRDNANVHRGIHELSRRATEAFEAARVTVAEWIGTPDPHELIWTRGTTEGINLVAWSWGTDNLREGDEIVLSTMEHHSNLVPWQLLARRTGAKLRYLEINARGRLRVEDLPWLLGPKTKLVALGHVSNALGTVNPVADIIREVRAHSPAKVLLDGAQAVPHLPVNVAALDCDFYAFSGHKMCGPTGIGGLWARKDLLESMNPFHGGGEMIRVVEREMSTWASVPHKFEAGTPDIAGAIGLGAAVEYLRALGPEAILAHERTLVTYALERLKEIPQLHVFGSPKVEERSGVIAFALGDAHPHDISTILDSEGIAIRAGHHCAQLVMKHYGIAASARASFYIYNTTADVDRLVDGLQNVRKMFGL
jgi:cysteine desulfurase / selenocysteine lyase